jgi:hypothetical protein
MAGTILDDTYGSCDICDQVNGCTDAGAINYDVFATDDDGSCLFSTTFNVDMNCEPAGSFGYVHLESPVFGWCGGCVPMTDPDGDGVHSVTVDLPAGNFEYKYAVDGFAGQEDLIDDMVGGASCAPVTDYFSYANRVLEVNSIIEGSVEHVVNGEFTSSMAPGWISSPAWASINSKADLWHQSGSDLLSQTLPLVIGNSYKLTFDAEVTTGGLIVVLGHLLDPSFGYDSLLSVTTSGAYSVVFVANQNRLEFMPNISPSDLTIDNVSVIDVTYDSSPNQEDTYGSCSECILDVLIHWHLTILILQW